MQMRWIAAVSSLALLAASLSISAAAPAAQSLEQVERAPLRVEQILARPDMQLLRSQVPSADGIRLRGTSVTIDGWKYSVMYRYTPEQGWRLDKYGFVALDARGSGLTPSHDGGLTANLLDRTNKELPPGPGDIPEPTDPVDPAKPATKPGASCPYAPGWDASWTLKWVPGHWEEDEDGHETGTWVEGHWKLSSWTVRESPSDLCG